MSKIVLELNQKSPKKQNLKKTCPRAILVDLIDLETSKEEELKRLEELESLVNTYGGVVVVKVIQKRGLPDYRTFIGKGKLEDIKEIVKEEKIDVIILNNLLKSTQIWNLTEMFQKDKVQVWDRVDLILKIFEKHAKTVEAKLQIELASIKHMGPRIFGMGMELSRQSGAMGLRAGAGESNIEIMKRHLHRQEQKIREKLKSYDKIREGHRKRRRRKNLKTVALVGYTNAGKSTLLRALTGKDVYIADELFATLDTRVGDLYIQPDHNKSTPNAPYVKGQQLLISDTIGFIQDLPPSLIEAFKSTLAETIESDLILHVIDANDSFIKKKIDVVEDILNQLGLSDKPKIYVFNKTDIIPSIDMQTLSTKKKGKIPERKSLMKAGEHTSKVLGWAREDAKRKGTLPLSPKQLRSRYKKYSPVFVSAVKKKGLEELEEGILKKLR